MIFDALEYFKTLGKKNRLCKQHGFKPVFCSGPDSIEGVMQEFQKTANFVMIDLLLTAGMTWKTEKQS